VPDLARILQEAVGVAETIDALIARVHQAKYRAKQGGRNQVIPVAGPSSVVDLTGRSNSRS